MTPEAKFGISDEPDTTCKFVDKEIDNLNHLSTELNNSVEDGFETIRKLNESLRAWGDAWKTACLEVSDSFETAQEEIEDLKKHNKDLTEEVEDLQTRLDNEIKTEARFS